MWCLLRVLVVSVAMFATLAPQIACFMPNLTVAPHCTKTDLSFKCCGPAISSNVGIAAKAIQTAASESDLADTNGSAVVSKPFIVYADLSLRRDHAPPPETRNSVLVLRI